MPGHPTHHELRMRMRHADMACEQGHEWRVHRLELLTAPDEWIPTCPVCGEWATSAKPVLAPDVAASGARGAVVPIRRPVP